MCTVQSIIETENKRVLELGLLDARDRCYGDQSNVRERQLVDSKN